MWFCVLVYNEHKETRQHENTRENTDTTVSLLQKCRWQNCSLDIALEGLFNGRQDVSFCIIECASLCGWIPVELTIYPHFFTASVLLSKTMRHVPWHTFHVFHVLQTFPPNIPEPVPMPSLLFAPGIDINAIFLTSEGPTGNGYKQILSLWQVLADLQTDANISLHFIRTHHRDVCVVTEYHSQNAIQSPWPGHKLTVQQPSISLLWKHRNLPYILYMEVPHAVISIVSPW